MARSGKKRKIRRIVYRTVLIAVIIFCILTELGQHFPQFPFPGWDEWYGMTALNAPMPAEGELEVHILDVGNADCILVRQGEQNLLIDAGEAADFEVINEYLIRHGIRKLDYVIATHPHADHIGSMARLIRKYPIDRFIMSYMPEEDTPTGSWYVKMLVALDTEKVVVEEAKPGNTYMLGTAQIKILAPLSEIADGNDMSVVCSLAFGSNRFLLMGDAGTAVEQQLLLFGADVRADVIKVGHHGSSDASSAAFIRRVAPRYAAVTCGKGNSYGHPHKETLDVLNKANATVYRSDLYGHIVFTSDGSNITVTTEKE